MFDSVGQTRKPNLRRQLGSFMVSMLVNGGLVGGAIWAGNQVVEEVLDDDEPVEVTFYDMAPPPPPPPPPPAGGSKPKIEKPEEPEEPEDPEEEPEEPEELPEEPEEEEPPEEEPEVAGVEGGMEGGVEGGVVGGVVGGVIGGQLGGQLGGTGARAVHWSEVKAKRRVAPKMPESAKALNMKEERCQVRFFIDEKGKPYDIQLETCPKIFHESAKAAAWQWRFYPMKDGGKAVKAQFVLGITYRLK